MSKHNSVHEETYRGCKIRLEQDDNRESPREWSNLGTMFCLHSRYNLGDKLDGWRNRPDPETYLRRLADKAVHFGRDADEIPAEHIQAVLAKHYVILDLYLYDHSGITISCAPFSCPWDSGRVGIINCELERIVSPKEYNYVNDSANVTFEIDLALFAPWIRAYLKENAAAWENHLFSHYRSRDGFISYYPANATEWQPFIDAMLDGQEWPETHGWHSRGIPEQHLLGRLLEFYLLNEDEETDIKMYYDVGDSVYVGEFIDIEKVKEHLKKE